MERVARKNILKAIVWTTIYIYLKISVRGKVKGRIRYDKESE